MKHDQANPQLLPGLLQMISTQNPELAELIANNQAEFLQMMSEGERGGALDGNYCCYVVMFLF